MISTPVHLTSTATTAARDSVRGWTEDEAGLILALFDFNAAWIPALLLLTMALLLTGRRRPGRLLAVGLLGRSTRMRRRVETLCTDLESAVGPVRPVLDKGMLATRLTERRRWDVARLWLYGPGLLTAVVMLHGALGGWGGQARLWPVASSLVFLALAGVAAGVEAWSRRRADPYGNAVHSGVVVLEALVRDDSAESRFRSAWRAFRSGDRRPTAYFSVDWTFRSVEGFCLSMEHLACHAVRSGDQVGRARRECSVRVFTAHVQEGLVGYCDAADAHAAGNASGADVRAARRRVVDLVSRVLVQLCQDRLALPDLEWDDLPEDRRNASPPRTGRRAVVQAGIAVLVLAVLALLFTWAGVPGEFVSPVLVALGGIVAVLLPRARWSA